MTFRKGTSGNPQGKPMGTLSKRTQLSKLLEPHAEELVNKAVELAKNGDSNALRLCIERLIPKPKEELVQFPLPQQGLNNPEGLLQLGTQVITAAANGEITIEQSLKLFNIINTQGEVINLVEITHRLAELEKTLKKRKD